ncbi:MAG TPA: hypothetical protein VF556_17685 [Pyrinomonadaceae bacterium]|jgi:hypothetical protein
MSEKKEPKTKKPKTEESEVSQQVIVARQRLTVGVNFTALGDDEETRVEAGVIEKGTLPPALEQTLRERKQLFDLKVS